MAASLSTSCGHQARSAARPAQRRTGEPVWEPCQKDFDKPKTQAHGCRRRREPKRNSEAFSSFLTPEGPASSKLPRYPTSV